MSNDRISVNNSSTLAREIEVTQTILGTLTTDDFICYVLKERNTFTIINVVLATSSGTCTASLRKNGSAITGISGVSVTSTPTAFAPSSTTTVTTNDKITLTVDSTSSGDNLIGQFNARRDA